MDKRPYAVRVQSRTLIKTLSRILQPQVLVCLRTHAVALQESQDAALKKRLRPAVNLPNAHVVIWEIQLELGLVDASKRHLEFGLQASGLDQGIAISTVHVVGNSPKVDQRNSPGLLFASLLRTSLHFAIFVVEHEQTL